MNTKALEAAREVQRRMRERGEVVRRTPLEKLRDRPTSLRAAVTAKCFDCVGGEHADQGYRRAVRECPAGACPLHRVRPYQPGLQEDGVPA